MKFLRSVIPADPWQLVFLAGTIFVFISPRLGWWPKSILSLGVTPEQRTNFFVFVSSWMWLVILASLVSYFLCFWSGSKRILQISFGVLFPALVGLGGIFNRYFQLSYLRRSVLETPTGLAVLWRFPTGVYFCVAGLFLIFVFTLRIRLGISSLPISLLGPIAPEREAEDTWNRYKWLIFVLLGPYFLFARVIGVLLGLTYLLGHRSPEMVASHPTSLATVLESVLLVAVLLLILGKSCREAVRKSIELPEPRCAFVALLFSVGISLTCAAVPYTAERIQWAAYNFGKTEMPQFLTYFDVGRAWEPWLLLLIFGALAEEIIFRGVLLPRLVQRYGLGRGIFFTGIVWAAIHFQSHSYTGLSVEGVLYHLLRRILICLAMNYVFSWATLRWKSVIPSTAAHAVWNMIVFEGVNEAVAWNAELSVILWAVLAILLFRYWPVRGEEEQVTNSATPDSVVTV